MATPRRNLEDLRVRIARDRKGRVVGFQDPDKRSVFISRADAVKRLRINPDTRQIEDSFGNRVGVGALALPGRGIELVYKTKMASFTPLAVDPRTYNPKPNEEIIERTTFATKKGRLITSETSYGLGEKYDPSKTGGRWRRDASKALGVSEGGRLPTRDLQRAVLHKEYIIKRISG